MIKNLLKEEHSISQIVLKISKDIQDCILDDIKNINELFSPYERYKYKTNKFKLSFQDDFPFLKDIILNYTVYLADDIDEYNHLMKNRNITFNSSYDDKTNELKIVTCFLDGQPTLDFSESIIHEITHMYQYNIGMTKRQNIYDKVIEMYSDGNNTARKRVAIALYYTFPHEQDAFVHQYYKRGVYRPIETFMPYMVLTDEYTKLKEEYKTNQSIQSAIHELGYSCKNYFKRLHFGLKRLKTKLENVKRYWSIKEMKEKNKPNMDTLIQESQLHMIWRNDGYNYWAPDVIEDKFNFITEKETPKSKLYLFINEELNNNFCRNISAQQAIDMILASMPYKMTSFDNNKQNRQTVEYAIQNNIGYWLFAEYFMKQREPLKVAKSLNYLATENALASWELRTISNNKTVFWITDVQSLAKGGFTILINYAINYCKENGISKIGLQAYSNDVESMYIQKFGFEKINNNFLIKNIE